MRIPVLNKGRAGALHYVRLTSVFREMEDFFHGKEHGWRQADRENHEWAMWEVLAQMKEQMLDKIIEQDSITFCRDCGDRCKADDRSCISPLSQDYRRMLEGVMYPYDAARVDVWSCNHYLCRVCIANLHTRHDEEYTCLHCEQDITYFIRNIIHDRQFMSVEGDDEYQREVADDIDSGAETEDERDD